MGNMANPNEVLGFLHACYGAGAVLAPLIATTMITKGSRLPWYYFYYVMVYLPIPLCTNSFNNSYQIDRHGRHRTRNLHRRLLARNRRRLPRPQPSHSRRQGQPHDRSFNPPASCARHLALRLLLTWLCGH
jgi:hypothetical protein